MTAGRLTLQETVAPSGSLHDELWDLRVLRSAERYQNWVLDSFGASLGGRVLEVGAGNGNFTRWLGSRCESIVALEPDDEMRGELLALGLEHVEVHRDAIEDFVSSGSAFDCVLMINVLEHIENDHRALTSAKRLLRDGGRVCILVPAHEQLFGALDRKYHHVRRYRREALIRALIQVGLVPQSVRYINPLGAVGWFLVSRLLGAKSLTKGSVLMSERIAVPIGRWLDKSRLRLPFGQSIVAIARVEGATGKEHQ